MTAQEWSDCQDGVAILHDRLINVGHTWPSLETGTDLAIHNTSFDATSAVWAFFERFTLPASHASASD